MFRSLLCKLFFLWVVLQNEKALAFNILFTSSFTHKKITTSAILQKTAEVCQAQAILQGRDFVLPSVLTAESVTTACSLPESAKGFKHAMNKISNRNAWVDAWHMHRAEYHFHDEMFVKARDLITEGVTAVKAAARQNNYGAARERLGVTLHTLQDFYSHSNWIELGNRFPYSNLIRPDSTIENIAELHQATCRSCDGNCKNNILDNIISEKKLTSGYFGFSKPSGKCSHGNFGDFSSLQNPTGGINKDTRSSSHGHLHDVAARVAIDATKELLEDIRSVIGDSDFLRLMGFTQNSVLCFVIDTTGSMSDEIAEVKRVTSYIIDSTRGTSDEPLEYILVPFNDPGFGPLYRTTDPETFKLQLNTLQAEGGGDEPELSLSALQLALTGSPPKTEIFVFTDAHAKDIELLSTVNALIESTESVVNFFLTNILRDRRRRSDDANQGQKRHFSNRLFPTDSSQIYVDLALASGGQAIEVTKSTLPQATSIVVDTSIPTLVTVFQTIRKTGNVESFSFIIDSSLKNVTIYITGSSPVFNVTSPSGVSQSSEELRGQLGLVESVGNFYTVRLTTLDLAGLWYLTISSAGTYTVKVVGQSDVDFLFTFVELAEDAHSGYSELSGRPPANSNLTLLLSMVGGDSVTPTEVALVEAMGSQTVRGTFEEVGGGDFLVTMNSVPPGKFVVRVKGQRSVLNSSEVFQRQSGTQYRASSVVITARTDEIWQPGKTLSIPFTLMYNGSDEHFKINARNDRGFVTEFPSTMFVASGSSGNGTVSLTATPDTPSGTEVTLTIEATALHETDFNYAVLKLTVVAPVTDFTHPVCEIVSINANCSGNCSLSSWELLANLTDGNGTGIMTVMVRQGLGSLNTSTVLGDGGENVTLAFYRASCCSQEMELVVVDRAGNVGTCSKSIRPSDTPTPTTFLSTYTTTPNTTSSTYTITPNTTSSTYTTTNIKPKTTFFPSTTKSAGNPLYVYLWVSVGAVFILNVLCF